MQCSETGSQVIVRLEHLKLDVARDIDSTIGAVATCSDAEGSVFFKILKGGGIGVIEMMTRKIRAKKRIA